MGAGGTWFTRAVYPSDCAPMEKGTHRIELVGGDASASPEQAAALVAALERFIAQTTPAPTAHASGLDPWRRAALLEGISREPLLDVPDSWINA